MIAEHLRAGRRRHHASEHTRTREGKPKPVAAPESNDAVFPRSHAAAFEQKRGKFKPADLSKRRPALQMEASGTIGGENHLTGPLSITNPDYSFLLAE
jgi:hypothetical protein